MRGIRRAGAAAVVSLTLLAACRQTTEVVDRDTTGGKGTGGTACTSLDFSPAGGTLNVGEKRTLVPIGNCSNPWLFPDHQEIATVTFVGGIWYLTGVAPGTMDVCIQKSQSEKTGLNCHVFTVTGGSSGSVTVGPVTSVTVSNCAGFQTTYPFTVYVNNVATTGTWTSSNTSVATVSSTGLVTLTGTAGTANITVSTGSGSVTIPITVNTCSQGGASVLPTGPFNLSSCQGSASTTTVSMYVNNNGSLQQVQATWTSSNTSVATVGSTSGIISPVIGASGSAVITGTYNGMTVQVTVNVGCSQQQGGVDSVTITPRSGTAVLGGQDWILTTHVWSSNPNISQQVTIGNSQTGCSQLTRIDSVTLRLHALAGCAKLDTIFATSNVDVTKTGRSVWTISSGTVTCTITSPSGANWNNTTQVMASGTNSISGNISCTNQFGTSFLPWEEINHPEWARVQGTTTKNIGGVDWQAGPQFTVTRVIPAGSPGTPATATITFHAAIDDQTVIAVMYVTLQ